MKFSPKHFFLLILNLVLFLYIPSLAQKPLGKFLEKEYKIGKPIHFALSYRHNPKVDVFFPDSSLNFSPFKYKSLEFFPTQTQNGVSLDSVIYEFVCFDIDSLQYLSLPVLTYSDKDSTTIMSIRDSIRFDAMITKEELSKAAIKPSIKYLEIRQEFNYPQFLKYILLLLAIISLFLVFFRKLLIRLYKMFWFDFKHQGFVKSFKKIMKSQKTNDIVATRKALVLWKNHMEWLENIPYSSFSTKEILEKIPNFRLEEALKEIDFAVYGGQSEGNLIFALKILNDVSSEKYKTCRQNYLNKLK